MSRYYAVPSHEDPFELKASSDEEVLAMVTQYNADNTVQGLDIVKVLKQSTTTLWQAGQ